MPWLAWLFLCCSCSFCFCNAPMRVSNFSIQTSTRCVFQIWCFVLCRVSCVVLCTATYTFITFMYGRTANLFLELSFGANPSCCPSCRGRANAGIAIRGMAQIFRIYPHLITPSRFRRCIAARRSRAISMLASGRMLPGSNAKKKVCSCGETVCVRASVKVLKRNHCARNEVAKELPDRGPPS